MDDIYLQRMEILLWFWWCLYHDLLRSKEVKFWSKLWNQGQIGQNSRNIPTIHMFRLQILSGIQIQDSLRSNHVIKRSNLGQNRQKRVKLGRIIGFDPYLTVLTKVWPFDDLIWSRRISNLNSRQNLESKHMYSGYISTILPDLTLIWRFWPKFDLFWPQKIMIHTSPKSQ